MRQLVLSWLLLFDSFGRVWIGIVVPIAVPVVIHTHIHIDVIRTRTCHRRLNAHEAISGRLTAVGPVGCTVRLLVVIALLLIKIAHVGDLLGVHMATAVVGLLDLALHTGFLCASLLFYHLEALGPIGFLEEGVVRLKVRSGLGCHIGCGFDVAVCFRTDGRGVGLVRAGRLEPLCTN